MGLFEIIVFSSDFDVLFEVVLKVGVDFVVKCFDEMVIDIVLKFLVICYCLE